jgi:hypothetical protein
MTGSGRFHHLAMVDALPLPFGILAPMASAIECARSSSSQTCAGPIGSRSSSSASMAASMSSRVSASPLSLASDAARPIASRTASIAASAKVCARLHGAASSEAACPIGSCSLFWKVLLRPSFVMQLAKRPGPARAFRLTLIMAALPPSARRGPPETF